MKQFSVGDEIEHKTFGRGVVSKVSGLNIGENVKLTIKFDRNDEYKMILSKYIKLIK